tara:strand:- start:154 stop:1071 length:918 start_codon:yes stop_codon:yes gene_type:complete
MIIKSNNHKLLSHTYTKSSAYHIGKFWPALAESPQLEENIGFICTPIIWNENGKLSLLNSYDRSLTDLLNQTSLNMLTPVIEVVKTDLSKQDLEDIFRLQALRSLSVKAVYDELFSIITSGNYVLKSKCPHPANQIRYLNDNYLLNNIGVNKLSSINKEIDTFVCDKILKERTNLKLEQIKDSYTSFRKANQKLFFSDFLRDLIEVTTITPQDISAIVSYFIENKVLLTPQILSFMVFLRALKKSCESFTIYDLMKIVRYVETTKRSLNGLDSYNFINGSLMDKSISKVSVVNFISAKLPTIKPT